MFQQEEKIRYIITKQYCYTNLVFILTSQQTGSVLLFLATLSIPKNLSRSQNSDSTVNQGLFFFSGFLDTDFTWNMLCPLKATKYPQGDTDIVAHLM